MKRTIGVTLIALGLLVTGAFLSTFISNPFAANGLSSSPSTQPPILSNANGSQQPNAMPVAHRATVQNAAYQPPVRPRRVTTTNAVNSDTRSWQKEAIIIGGSTAAGAGIGAIAGGGKGAAIGAISGGVAGLIYDMKTRKNGDHF
jgi:hypothetical protein